MKSYYYLFLIILVLVGCQENESFKPDENEIHVADGRLVFKDLDQLMNTFSNIGFGGVKVTDGKLPGFDYDSYYNSPANSPALNDQIDKAIDLYEYQILLNKNREIQVGDKIYLVNDDETIVRNMSTGLVNEMPNEVGYYDRSKKSFDQQSTGHQFGVVYDDVRVDIDPSKTRIIKYSFIRVKSIFINYYYQSSHHVGYYPASKVDYFHREISDCDGCTIWSDNPYGGFKRNVSTVTYYCGGHISAAKEAAYGINCRAVYQIKPYDYYEIGITHYLAGQG